MSLITPAVWADSLEIALAAHRAELEWVSAAHHRRKHRSHAPPFWWRLRADKRTWFCGVTLIYWHRTGVVPAFHDAVRIGQLWGLTYPDAVAASLAAATPAGELRRRISLHTATPWEIALVEGVARAGARWWRIGGRKQPQATTPP
jgi:hypothetical protein